MLTRIILLVFFVLAGCSQVDPSPAPTETTLPTEPEQAAAVPTETIPAQQASPTVADATQVSAPNPTGTVENDLAGQVNSLIQCSGVLTSPNQEGPYYLEGSPQKDDLVEAGMSGTPVVITGAVFDQDCRPLASARVDFWQADAAGVYDNAGYTLRGHVIAEESGIYSIRTIEPGPYTGRPPHIHVKVFAPDGRELLTTQLYFPGSEASGDVQAAPDLLVTYLESNPSADRQVLFNFTVPSP